MDTTRLQRFSTFARRALIEQVHARLKLVLEPTSAARREHPEAVRNLDKAVALSGRDQTVATVAYTWFNRFCALRFMDVNRYTRAGVVSPLPGQFQPEILAEAKAGHIDEDSVPPQTRQQITALLNGSAPSPDPQGEAYRLLVVAACNFWNGTMPFMFQKIDDYTELLMPDDLLSGTSILAYTREALTPEACQDVEVIGWLYQFYISEKKDEVFEGLKKNRKITPENIPAATQLFTPHWIVRYLVENSLGRLWMLNHPQSRLAEHMEYYIRPQQQETEFLRIEHPEEIRVCDPACGSGHMLTYAFDLLYAIYEETGCEASEIPQRILTHNLYGIEIDDRAGALAAFALTMKARARQRRFFSRPVVPQICVLQNVSIEEAELDDYLDYAGRNRFSDAALETLTQFQDAKNFGSLIRPAIKDPAKLRAELEELATAESLYVQKTHNQVLQVLRQAEFLTPGYAVVVANPPYMGSGGMNARLKSWLQKTFPVTKSDLMTCFIERSKTLAVGHGIFALITLPSWMFNSTFADLRMWLLDCSDIYSLVSFGRGVFGSDFGSVAFVASNNVPTGSRCTVFRKLYSNHVDVRKSEYIRELFLEKEFGHFQFPQEALKQVPGAPFAFWASQRVRDCFRRFAPLETQGVAASGIQTSDNNRYLRWWHEVSHRDVIKNAQSMELVFSAKAWVPHNKGGPFRRWYGNNDLVMAWHNGGAEAYKDPKFQTKNMHLQMLEAATWSHTSSGTFSVRYSPAGYSFNVEGPIFIHDASIHFAIGFLASKVSLLLLNILNPTLHFLVGTVQILPICPSVAVPEVPELIQIARSDWNTTETTEAFDRLPVLSLPIVGKSLPREYDRLRRNQRAVCTKMRALEESNNRIFIDAYGLQDELTPDVPLSEITLNCNPHYRYGSDKSEAELENLLLADTMRELVSYAVGCMFGRYALDKPGLILANQGETLREYLEQIPEPVFPADADNVIPMLDGDWFTDDIVDRFRQFLKVAFGEEHYAENMAFIEQGLNIKRKRNYSIRDYFVSEFYSDHVKRYRKRPIYWLFSSPRGSFNALIYMHRYRPDTVSVVLNNYLREYRAKLTAEKSRLEAVSISTEVAQAARTKALREITNLSKVLAELEEYERETLYPLATQQLTIDLDDGVRVNYPKFGKALKKITGLEASDE
jgi:hypothetical protein